MDHHDRGLDHREILLQKRIAVDLVDADGRAEHGYGNRGDAMNLSPLLLEKYVAVAGEIVLEDVRKHLLESTLSAPTLGKSLPVLNNP